MRNAGGIGTEKTTLYFAAHSWQVGGSTPTVFTKGIRSMLLGYRTKVEYGVVFGVTMEEASLDA